MQRTFLASGIPALAMTCAVAQSYPSKPIRIIAAQTAGGVFEQVERRGHTDHGASGDTPANFQRWR
jgi:tripartite-type tricarboxylate transporter receptor subunit TctC